MFVFRALMDDIYANWQRVTGDNVFPKLHMLRHAVEFAARHNILGAASEAQIESFHVKFNDLYHKQHRNTSHRPLERVRRCLSDAVAALVAPLLLLKFQKRQTISLKFATAPAHSDKTHRKHHK